MSGQAHVRACGRETLVPTICFLMADLRRAGRRSVWRTRWQTRRRGRVQATKTLAGSSRAALHAAWHDGSCRVSGRRTMTRTCQSSWTTPSCASNRTRRCAFRTAMRRIAMCGARQRATTAYDNNGFKQHTYNSSIRHSTQHNATCNAMRSAA